MNGVVMNNGSIKSRSGMITLGVTRFFLWISIRTKKNRCSGLRSIGLEKLPVKAGLVHGDGGIAGLASADANRLFDR